MNTFYIWMFPYLAILYCLLNLCEALENDEILPIDTHLEIEHQRVTNTESNQQESWKALAKNQTYNDKNFIGQQYIRDALSGAFNNQDIRRKLKDIMPVLQSLSKEQSAILSALIKAQINPKSSPEVQIDKVNHVFGNQTALLLSFVQDITSLVKRSANNFNDFGFDRTPKAFKFENSSFRRSADLTTEELEEENIGVEEQALDPRSINEQLMSDFYFEPIQKVRQRRSAKLLHKLIRIPPPQSAEEQLVSENYVPPDMKLNTSIFAGPYYIPENSPQDLGINSTTLSYEKIEDLALADLNGTEIEMTGNDTNDEQLPEPEELVAGPRYRIPSKHRIIKVDSKRKRMPSRPHPIVIVQKQCERFTASMCIKADDYPLEQIMGSIRRHKNAMSALLAEYRDKAAELEYQEQLEEYQLNSKRREDGNVITPGGMCPSIVRYARPQKARSASGEWKYIVNTGKHSQTLRLEKCSTPQESCSYLSHNYRSRCTQVYNYHRLLSWDKTRGLHVDIFKVPACCSCQVDGYRETFPPLGGSKHKDYSPVSNNNPYVSMNDEIDYEDEDEDDGSLPYHFSDGYKSHEQDQYGHSELLLESTNVKTKVNHPGFNPTVGSYLSPPSGKYEFKGSTKHVRPTYYTHSNVLSGRSRKQHKNSIPNEPRVDLGITGTDKSDTDTKSYTINANTRTHQKRTRLYSGASNVESPYQTSGPIIASDVIPTYNQPTERLSTKPSSNVKNLNGVKEVVNGKRVNYNYHPIIDFFETHQKSVKGQTFSRGNAKNVYSASSEMNSPRDRRVEMESLGSESNWHPVVVNS